MKYLAKFRNWFGKKRLISKIGLIFLVFICIVLFFASSIAKWYINANGEDLSGRKLHVDDLSINYLTFSVTAGDFVMYEANKKDTFVYLGSVYANMNSWALLGGQYDLSAVELDRLQVTIIEQDSVFNFSDLISDEPADTTASPTEYFLNNIKISNSEIEYISESTNTTYPIHDLELSLKELHWNGGKMSTDLAFDLGDKGHMDIDFGMNNKEHSYKIGLKTKFIDLNYGGYYAKQLLNIQSNTGYLHTDLTIDGSLIDPMDVAIQGTTSLSQLNMIDKKGNPFISIDSIGMNIDSINLSKNYFVISETNIFSPVTHTTMDAYSTNIDYVLSPLYTEEEVADGEEASEPEILDTTDVEPVSAEPEPFHFVINQVKIHNGEVNYTDLTMDRPFQYTLKGIELTSKNIGAESRNLSSTYSMRTPGGGSITGDAVFDLVNTDNITINTQVRSVDMKAFSPFTEYYVAAPIENGLLNYDLGFKMTSTHMDNTNKFDIRKLEFGKKIKSDSAYKVPVKVALALLKDRNGNTQFEIPVSGDPSDPDFKPIPVILKVFGKFMIKVAASPLTAIANLGSSDPENINKLVFDLSQDDLTEKQKNKLEKIIGFSKEKPELTFAFEQISNTEDELIEISIREAKKRYSPSEWQNVSDKDQGFVDFLVQKTGGTKVQDMCIELVTKSVAQSKLNELKEKRNSLVSNYLKAGGMKAESFSVSTSPSANGGVKKPFFQIEVGTR